MVGPFVVDEEAGDDGEVAMLGASEEDMKVVEEEEGDDGGIVLLEATEEDTKAEETDEEESGTLHWQESPAMVSSSILYPGS